MTHKIILHTAYDGTITFKESFTNRAIGYAGWAGFIYTIAHTQGWKAFGSPSQESGYFVALSSPYSPEDLPIDPGFDGWHRLSLDDLLDFVGEDEVVV